MGNWETTKSIYVKLPLAAKDQCLQNELKLIEKKECEALRILHMFVMVLINSLVHGVHWFHLGPFLDLAH